MRRLAVITKNIKGGFYNPVIDTLPFNNLNDAVQRLTRDAKMCNSSDLIKIKDLEQYGIGWYDDDTGKLVLFDNPEYLIEYGSYYQNAVERESIKNE